MLNTMRTRAATLLTQSRRSPLPMKIALLHAGRISPATSALKAVPKLIERFRTGEGFGWHEHDTGLFRGTELFFRPGYAANLVSSWIPSLEGVEAKLNNGAKVADVGCGLALRLSYGASLSNSAFTGFDYHDGSIEMAKERAKEAGVSDRVNFEIAKAKDYPGTGYDLVTFFDCLHDMGDPVGASAHVLESLAPMARG